MVGEGGAKEFGAGPQACATLMQAVPFIVNGVRRRVTGGGRVVGAEGEQLLVVSTLDRLHAVELLRDCTAAQLEEVVRLAERVQVGEGEVVAREGRIGREFFLILSGTVAVSQQGRTVNTLGPGQFFGELAAIIPGPRNATVTALTDLDLLIIGPREFAAMAEIPGFRDALLKSMARRLQTVDAQLAAVLSDQRAAVGSQTHRSANA